MARADVKKGAKKTTTQNASRNKKSPGRGKRNEAEHMEATTANSAYWPMKNNDEVRGSNGVPCLKSKIEQSAPIELTKKVTRKELEEKIAFLETIIKQDS